MLPLEQYFWPALSDNRSWKPFLVFLSVAVLHRFYCTLGIRYLPVNFPTDLLHQYELINDINDNDEGFFDNQKLES